MFCKMVSGLSTSSWKKRPEPFPSTTTLFRLAKFILTLNNFSFNSSHFHQVGGVATGTCMGPSYVCPFVECVEHSLFPDSIPFSQFLHLHCICSNDANFIKGASGISSFFLNQGFPSTIVNSSLNWVSPISHTLALTCSHNSDRVSLVVTYHPTRIHIPWIISNHYCHIQRDAITRHIFPLSPLSAFHKDHSLQDTL
eukprot:g37763.t1